MHLRGGSIYIDKVGPFLTGGGIEEEAPLKDQKITLLEQRVSNLEKENDLLKQQNTLQEKLTELAKREAEVYRIAFEKENVLNDRALKLAEVGKPNSNWEFQEVLGLAAYILGFVVGSKGVVNGNISGAIAPLTLTFLRIAISTPKMPV
jgi:hypothetical protein